MAFASVGTLGSAQDKTAGTTIQMTTSAAAEAGNLVIVVVARDEGGLISSISDSAGGNTWKNAADVENAAGSAASIWYSVLTNQIANGGTITANFNFSP